MPSTYLSEIVSTIFCSRLHNILHYILVKILIFTFKVKKIGSIFIFSHFTRWCSNILPVMWLSYAHREFSIESTGERIFTIGEDLTKLLI